VCRDTVLSVIVHGLGADLDLDGSTGRIAHHGVQ
jgi:hypothetical protein